jgi:hypothetical protein
MITYDEVKALIHSALTGRPEGQEILPEEHEAAETKILDYIEQLKSATTGSVIREAHAAATKGQNCNLTWDTAFTDSNYSFVLSLFDSRGNPVLPVLISKSSTKIVIKTSVNATVYAMARPYGGNTI